MRLVCPRCKGPLAASPEAYRCRACAHDYPVICGIPDFRLWPDPYIGIEADRRKGEALFAAAKTRTFEEMLHHYYAITPEDPADLAAHWTAHALAEVEIAASLLAAESLAGHSLLDVGCSTGGLLIAARDRFSELTGVDVAFRWLVIARKRLEEAGVRTTLVCANAEALPFAAASFDVVTATDALEHMRSAALAVHEMCLLRPAVVVATGNNRFAPLPDPQVRLWGVGWLPAKWQARYVARRRGDLHRYHVRMLGFGEARRLFRAAGFVHVRVKPALLSAPHLNNRLLQTLLRLYNRFRFALRPVAPRWLVRAR